MWRRVCGRAAGIAAGPGQRPGPADTQPSAAASPASAERQRRCGQSTARHIDQRTRNRATPDRRRCSATRRPAWRCFLVIPTSSRSLLVTLTKRVITRCITRSMSVPGATTGPCQVTSSGCPRRLPCLRVADLPAFPAYSPRLRRRSRGLARVAWRARNGCARLRPSRQVTGTHRGRARRHGNRPANEAALSC